MNLAAILSWPRSVKDIKKCYCNLEKKEHINRTYLSSGIWSRICNISMQIHEDDDNDVRWWWWWQRRRSQWVVLIIKYFLNSFITLTYTIYTTDIFWIKILGLHLVCLFSQLTFIKNMNTLQDVCHSLTKEELWVLGRQYYVDRQPLLELQGWF